MDGNFAELNGILINATFVPNSRKSISAVDDAEEAFMVVPTDINGTNAPETPLEPAGVDLWCCEDGSFIIL